MIILATTRSNELNHLGNGSGFLMSPHRTNGWSFSTYTRYLMFMNILLVAITRAQALLIVIGDPDVLGKDYLWRAFLNYVISRKGCTGKTHSWKTEELYLPRYEMVPRKGGVLHGEEFIGGKSEKVFQRVA